MKNAFLKLKKTQLQYAQPKVALIMNSSVISHWTVRMETIKDHYKHVLSLHSHFSSSSLLWVSYLWLGIYREDPIAGFTFKSEDL